MTVNIRRLLYILLGLIPGFAAFAAVELLTASGLPNYMAMALSQGAAIGFIFGFSFGFADGIIYRELKTGLLRAVIAAAAGAVTAAAAQILASQGMLLTANAASAGYSKSMHILLPLWRGFGWMLMGAAIGTIDGIQQLSGRRAAAGAIGGLIGGLLGGLVFELLIQLRPETGCIKLAGLVLMGALIGLFIGEFEHRFSFARLKILNGPLKGREYLMVKNRITIGDGFRNDIRITAYDSLSQGILIRSGREIHFEMPEKESAQGLSAKAAAVDATLLNDDRISGRTALKFQDVIQLGKMKMIYLPL